MSAPNFGALGGHVASELEAHLDADPGDEALRSRLAERAGSRKPRAAWTTARVLVPGFGLAVAIAAAFLLVPRETPRSLTFTVGTPERPGVLGATVTAPHESGTSLRFSEGSRIALDPLAKAKVASLGSPGAELVLESGRARVDIVPRPENAWRVQTGPFVVSVTGTRFDVAWDPGADRFSLELYEGKVTVSGCSFGSGQKLVAGQRAEASCKAKTQTVAPLSSAAQPATERAATAPKAADAVTTAQPSGPGTASDPAPQPPRDRASEALQDWTALARSGRYADAYALAKSAGIAGECERRGADDVLLLGETARLTDHAEEARQAYQSVRRRFAGSAAAAQAAFNLGRLEVRAGKKAASSAWFETYLREQPSGPLAQAALGRLLEARVDVGDTRAARDTARSYLERYPAGPHADAARKVLESGTKP